jgi:hypothetical protein
MAAMAAAQPFLTGPVITVRPRRPRRVSLLWIGASVVGAIVGAVVAAQIRSFLPPAPSSVTKDVAYIATVVDVLLLSGTQWFVLRRQHLDVDWWVPATVVANLITAIVVIPTVLSLFVETQGRPNLGAAIASGAAALAAAGLVVGLAQAVVLRTSSGNVAWLWLPATVLGGALAGAFTTAVAAQLLGLPALATITLVAATGALMTATVQAPVLLRVLR